MVIKLYLYSCRKCNVIWDTTRSDVHECPFCKSKLREENELREQAHKYKLKPVSEW